MIQVMIVSLVEKMIQNNAPHQEAIVGIIVTAHGALMNAAGVEKNLEKNDG